MCKSQFESLGVYHPERVVSTDELVGRLKNKPMFNLEELTGIKTRRWRSETEDSYTLAISAARKCLEKSRYNASELDVIIFSSITHFKDGLKYWMEPNMSSFLKNTLGMRGDAINFDMTNACAGMLTSVYILNNMIKTGAVKTGMIVSGECITPITETAIKEIMEPIDPQFASLTVGDSGAALIMDRTDDENEGIDFIEFMTLAEYSDLCLGMPSSKNPGVAMYTKAMEIHKEVLERLPLIMKYALEKNSKLLDIFDYLIPHQTSAKAIKSGFSRVSNFFKSKLPEILVSLHKYGNTSSTSHFVVLDDFLQQKSLKKNSRFLFLPLASGLVMGVISAKIGILEEKYGYGN